MNSISYNVLRWSWRASQTTALSLCVYNVHGLAWGLCTLLGITLGNAVFELCNEERY